uniref:Uncharacterized protein n=1 Tax=Oryza glumipatula TaxID=40148 RepID=A0A0D9YYU6_9ORYZ
MVAATPCDPPSGTGSAHRWRRDGPGRRKADKGGEAHAPQTLSKLAFADAAAVIRAHLDHRIRDWGAKIVSGLGPSRSGVSEPASSTTAASNFRSGELSGAIIRGSISA